jgi:hypothetical protein
MLDIRGIVIHHFADALNDLLRNVFPLCLEMIDDIIHPIAGWYLL